ncbi:hypothetical protein BX600DRAFT_443380 [Xylariales sp. PMI_506]|nr:hypothetical protein BX600DRAFT_443380 [Xylariales sp. PMI_506]
MCYRAWILCEVIFLVGKTSASCPKGDQIKTGIPCQEVKSGRKVLPDDPDIDRRCEWSEQSICRFLRCLSCKGEHVLKWPDSFGGADAMDPGHRAFRSEAERILGIPPEPERVPQNIIKLEELDQQGADEGVQGEVDFLSPSQDPSRRLLQDVQGIGQARSEDPGPTHPNPMSIYQAYPVARNLTDHPVSKPYPPSDIQALQPQMQRQGPQPGWQHWCGSMPPKQFQDLHNSTRKNNPPASYLIPGTVAQIPAHWQEPAAAPGPYYLSHQWQGTRAQPDNRSHYYYGQPEISPINIHHWQSNWAP